MPRRLSPSLLAFAVLLPGLAAADDVDGAKEHPLFTRFPGAEITRYEELRYDERKLVASLSKQGALTVSAGGQYTSVHYRFAKGTSRAEVLANYRRALSEAGYATQYECQQEQCGDTDPYDAQTGINSYEENQAYLYAVKAEGAEKSYLALYLGHTGSSPLEASLQTLQAKPADTEQVQATTPVRVRTQLQTTGRFAVYDILFDTDRATLKSESAPALGAIAQALKAQPELKLYVVGHTDNQGDYRHNLELSKQRAEAVVASLTEEHGVHAKRLIAQGVGPLAPVASNGDEAGKQKNRRVELVSQ